MIPQFKIYWDDADINAVQSSIMRGTQWAEGPNIEIFEQKIAEYLGVKGVLVCNSGTSALHMAVMASGIKHYHEVIVPSFTFIATANAVKFVGATPVFADIEDETLGLDPADVERKITPKTKAIIAVHYAGGICRIRELQKIAIEHNLILIEDTAEAMGATIDGQKAGTFGDCAILSFCQNKIITTGEGGALVTNNKYIYDKAKLLRSHGKADDRFVALGYNFRMSDMVAALGVAQINKIDKILSMRKQITKQYEIGGIIKYREGHVYQMMPVRLENRDKIKAYLNESGVACSDRWFQPIHLTEFYRRELWQPVCLPVSEKVSQEILCLPIYPGLTESEVAYICQKIKEC